MDLTENQGVSRAVLHLAALGEHPILAFSGFRRLPTFPVESPLARLHPSSTPHLRLSTQEAGLHRPERNFPRKQTLVLSLSGQPQSQSRQAQEDVLTTVVQPSRREEKSQAIHSL